MRLRINRERLWTRLMAMAEIGAIPGDGSCRLTLSNEDEAGRALLTSWCASRGYRPRRDAIGNLFYRRVGKKADAPSVLIGSHLDTQPTGGRFDGVLGVLAGLEVLETLDDSRVDTELSIELCVWTNEEGSRFQPAMMGSGVATGALSFDQACRAMDGSGATVGSELARHGYDREPLPAIPSADCYLELHIEQGPIQEAEERTIGVVTGGQGIRWYEVGLRGDETHAGPTPMAKRRDPVPALSALIDLVNRIGFSDLDARSTIGQITIRPGSINVVPGAIDLTIDLRHPEETTLDHMESELVLGIDTLKAQFSGIGFELTHRWGSPVVRFDPTLAGLVREASEALGLTAMDMVSGAGHDAFHLSRVVPTTMIFVPCREGVSHNPREYASPDDVAAGTDVLLMVALERAVVCEPSR